MRAPYYNFYFKDGFRDWDCEALILIDRYLVECERLFPHGIAVRQDCFGTLILEVPYSGDDEGLAEYRSLKIQRAEEIRNQVGQMQLMETTLG